MLVFADFLRSVGLMNEDYFLYFEEPDWYMKGKRSFSLAYADKAIVYHKVGTSTSKLDVNNNKTTVKFHLASQLRFALGFFYLAIPLVLLRIVNA